MEASAHNRWLIDWTISKWNNSIDKENGKEPCEVVKSDGNILLIGGVREFLKLLSGLGGTPYDAEHSRICVGSSATPENFHQTGILATEEKRAIAKMDDGFPYIDGSGTTLVYQASFGEHEANFVWCEASITNGDWGNCIALNRKTDKVGPKTRGTWTIRIRISIKSGEIFD